jgi:C-terminal processing protease CtpA/Prc
LATLLEENFVFPDKAQAYASKLRSRLAGGAYANFSDADAFANAVTADLQAVHSDRHLRVAPPRNASGRAESKPAQHGPPPGFKFISKAGWLANGVAYIRFEAFPGNEQVLAQLRDFIAKHKDAKSLIIDARSHRGGGLAEMDLLFPELFDKETVLVGMDTREAVDKRGGNPMEETTLRPAKGPVGVVRREHYVKPATKGSGLRRAKVYLLTSNRTASAAEHLALSLKRTGRATLIGETTRGAGHYGGVNELPHGYSVFIPVGRTFDPDNNQGWETVGVKPHIEVAADRALDEALRRAGVQTTGEAALASLR